MDQPPMVQLQWDQPLKNQKPRDQPLRNQKQKNRPQKNQRPRNQPLRNQKQRDQPLRNQKQRDQPLRNQKPRDQPQRSQLMNQVLKDQLPRNQQLRDQQQQLLRSVKTVTYVLPSRGSHRSSVPVSRSSERTVLSCATPVTREPPRRDVMSSLIGGDSSKELFASSERNLVILRRDTTRAGWLPTAQNLAVKW